MKLFLFLTLSLFSITTFGQNNEDDPLMGKVENKILSQHKQYINDSIPKVVYKTKTTTGMQPVFYINEKAVETSVIKTLDPEIIEKMEIEKDTFEMNGINYYGKILISTKNGYQPKLLSLNKLQAKYANTSNKHTVFLLDNKVINEDYDNFLVDENYILKIEISELSNSSKRPNTTVVQLYTRSKENIEKQNRIYIRGGDEIK